MDYELCKKLNNAGFPQGDGMMGKDKYYYNGDCTNIYIPTLSELIEACGDIILFKIPKENKWESESKGKWIAGKSGGYLCAESYFIDTTFDGEVGKTPEEAVAHLWLALQDQRGQ